MLTKKETLLKDQSGTAIVIALIMIIILTLIGLASTFTSNFEIKLSGNKRASTDAFYTADAGVQSALVNITNFNVPGNFVAVNPATLPVDLQNELIDSRFNTPTLFLPEGVIFKDPPRVTVYHTTRTDASRGIQTSATGNFEFEHYIIDSIGKDQMDTALLKSTCQVREKVIRLIPTVQAGN
jgi:Tfp pilus assembly protein PilX